MVNSHIQIPKFILKRFMNNKYKALYYVCGDDEEIKKSTPKSFNVEKGYYSDDMEIYLNKEIENKVSKLVCSIEAQRDKIIKEEYNINDYFDFENITKKYVYSLIARNKDENDKIKKDYLDIRTIGKENLIDFSTRIKIEKAFEANLLADYSVTLYFNQTNIPFVLPVDGIIEDDKSFLCPIGEKNAIYLVYKNNLDRIKIEEKDEVIHKLNKDKWEKIRDKRSGFIVSSKEDYLSKIIESN